MPLQAQVKTIPLYGSLDLKTDAKYVAPGKLLSAQNTRSPNVQGTSKRYGQSALGVSAGITQGRALGSFNSELLLFDGSSLWAYASGQAQWVERIEGITEIFTTRAPVIRGANTVTQVTSLRTDLAEVYAWQESSGALYYAVRDADSGTFIKPGTLLSSTGYCPCVFYWGNFIYIGYIDSASDIKLGRLNPYNLSSGVQITYQVSATTNATIVDFAPAGASLYVVYEDVLLNVRRFNANVIEVDSATAASVTAYQIKCCVSTDESDLIVARAAAGGASVALNLYFAPGSSLASTSSGTATPANANTFSGRLSLAATSPTEWTLLAGMQPQSTLQAAVASFSVADAAHAVNAAEGTMLNGLDLTSGIGTLGADQYAVGISAPLNTDGTTSQQASFYLFRTSDMRIVQRFGAGIAAYASSYATPTLVGDKLHVALLEQFALRADANGTVYGAAGITSTYFELPEVSRAQIVAFGTTAFISAGNSYTYDGSYVVESGFWEFPGAVATSISGGSIEAGTHFYQVTYEWTDSAGNIHYSAPSYPKSVVLGAPSQVDLELPYTALTLRTGDARDATINIYRTLANQQGPYYWVGSVSNAAAFASTNNRIATFSDNLADATIAVQRELYAPADFSGEIDNDAPPPFRCVVATKTRMFGIPQDDPYALWFSKPYNPGRPVEWSAAQIKRVEADGGLPTALGAIDTQAVVFKQARIYALPGQGPSASGQPFNAFGELELVSTTAGCTSQPSVLSTHEGCFFKGSTGLVALNRSFTSDFMFGIEVQPLATSLALTGALAVPAQNQYRWSSSDGTMLVFDYVTRRWSTYTNYDAVGYASYGATGARLRSDGTVYYEDVSTYADATLPVVMTLETPWIKPADLAQGYAAVWYASILGTFVDTHTLVVEIAYDYTDIPVQVVAWDPSAVNDLYGSDSPYGATVYYGGNALVYTAQYQVRVALRRQTCESVKFKIYDTGGTGASCVLNEVALQLGVVGGLNRVPVAQQV